MHCGLIKLISVGLFCMLLFFKKELKENDTMQKHYRELSSGAVV